MLLLKTRLCRINQAMSRWSWWENETIMLADGGASHIVSNTSPTTIEVESATLDSLVPDDCEISVIHLDVEGHEVEALEGATQLIKNNLPIIIVETFPSGFFEKHLAPLGYICHDQIHGNTILKIRKGH